MKNLKLGIQDSILNVNDSGSGPEDKNKGFYEFRQILMEISIKTMSAQLKSAKNVDEETTNGGNMKTLDTPKRILCLIEIEIDSFCEDESNSFANFMKNCGNETNNFVHLTPFYDFVPNKFNFSAYESNGTIGTPNQLVDRPSKPKLGF